MTRLFVLSFENDDDRKVQTEYYLPKVEIKDYNFMIDEKNFFDQPVKSDTRTYDNIRKIANGQVNNKHLMLIQKQYKEVILLQI